MFIHELKDVKSLFDIIGDQEKIIPQIIETDYWLMHCLWGLQQLNLKFELKANTCALR